MAETCAARPGDVEVSFQLTVLKVLAGQSAGRASVAEVRHAVEILMNSGRDWTDRMLEQQLAGLDARLAAGAPAEQIAEMRHRAAALRELIAASAEARRLGVAALAEVRQIAAEVHVTDGIAPGVVQLPTGAWYDPMDPEDDAPLCVHGNPNVLTRDIGTSSFAQGCTGQLTTVEVEKFTGNLPPIRDRKSVV